MHSGCYGVSIHMNSEQPWLYAKDQVCWHLNIEEKGVSKLPLLTVEQGAVVCYQKSDLVFTKAVTSDRLTML